jgi:hypothetical protein
MSKKTATVPRKGLRMNSREYVFPVSEGKNGKLWYKSPRSSPSLRQGSGRGQRHRAVIAEAERTFRQLIFVYVCVGAQPQEKTKEGGHLFWLGAVFQ